MPLIGRLAAGPPGYRSRGYRVPLAARLPRLTQAVITEPGLVRVEEVARRAPAGDDGPLALVGAVGLKR